MKANKELVSIVVPVYNSNEFIRDTIENVLEQTYTNWELILVNDCSTDNSKKIIEEYSSDRRIQLINNKKNSGAAIARNRGIEFSKGKFIAFLDADDLWEKDKLEKQIKFMKENKYDFTFTGYEFVNKEGKRTGKIVNVPRRMTYKQALKNTTIFTSTVIVNVQNIGKTVLKMPNVKSEDTATWWWLLKNNILAYGLNENLTRYRRSKGTLSSNKIEAIKRIWNLYRSVEKLNICFSAYNFCFYAINAIRRRI